MVADGSGAEGETPSAYRGVGTHLAGFHLIPRVFNVRSFHHTGQHQMTNDAVAFLDLVFTPPAIIKMVRDVLPTGVGNWPASRRKPLPSSVHPHGCGERP